MRERGKERYSIYYLLYPYEQCFFIPCSSIQGTGAAEVYAERILSKVPGKPFVDVDYDRLAQYTTAKKDRLDRVGQRIKQLKVRAGGVLMHTLSRP